MIDYILLAVILALLGYIAWEKKESKTERQKLTEKLIHLAVSKNFQEVKEMELIEKTPIPAKVPFSSNGPEDVAVEDMTEEEFDNHIRSLSNG